MLKLTSSNGKLKVFIAILSSTRCSTNNVYLSLEKVSLQNLDKVRILRMVLQLWHNYPAPRVDTFAPLVLCSSP